MSKDILKKTARIRQILSLLDKGPVVLKDLSNGGVPFDVNVRTLQRDMDLLKKMKIPLALKKGGAYYFRKGFSLERAKKTPQQLASLSVLADVVQNLHMEKDIFKENLFDASPMDLNKYLPKDASLLQNPLIIDLQSAVNGRNKIRITLKNERKAININPYELVTINGKNYVVSMTTQGKIKRYATDNIDTDIKFYSKKYTYIERDWELLDAIETWEKEDSLTFDINN